MTSFAAALLIVFCMATGMLIFMEIGRRLGLRRLAKAPGSEILGAGVVEGALFGLLGLLIAFTFSGAAARFDARRQLIVQETNAIGTAYLRVDLLPAASQPQLRDAFRSYVDARIAVYRKFPDLDAVRAQMARATALQGVIWTMAVAASREAASPSTPSLVLSALNEMIDITTTRAAALETHPPFIIFGMLFVVAIYCSILAGYVMAGNKRRHWLHALAFATTMSVAIYVIIDIEFPRIGLVRIDAADHFLVDQRNSMN